MLRADLDRRSLGRALQLAEESIGLTDPNPRVGCVIGGEDGTVWGEGATCEAGGAHAEVMALRAVQAAGRDPRGGTAWVTLEPCSHHGRTPPCCDALIRAGVARVVVGTQDPNPRVAGAGIARLRQAGIQVEMADSEIADAAWQLNIGFFSRALRTRPWIRAKVAASIDGRTALDNGVSKWITGPEARTDGHRWRRRASAVLTGIGTVLADDPRLDVRRVPSSAQPLRIVVDSTLRTPKQARVLQAPGSALLIAVDADDNRRAALQAAGAEVWLTPAFEGHVGLANLVAELNRREVNELHVEAGPRLTTAMLLADLVDELLVYLAPRLVGGGRGIVDWRPLQRLEEGMDFQFVDATMVGSDLRVRLRSPASEQFARLARASGIFTDRSPPDLGVARQPLDL